MVELGVAISPASRDLSAAALDATARSVLDAGIRTLWALDNPLADQAEPLTLLGFAAARYPELKVGTAAIVGPVREPLLLAKQAATLDRLTGGHRLAIGLTIGRRPDEYLLTSREFSKRGLALEDLVRVLKACWAGTPVAVDGHTGSWMTDRPIGVAPATPNGPPVLVGGQAARAIERAVRLGDGYLAPATGGPAVARRAAAQVRELLPTGGTAFRLVANVFVTVAATRADAITRATAAFTARHGGPPPWNPGDVVVGGGPAEVADSLRGLMDAGYDGLNLVPVVPEIDQLQALRLVVAELPGSPAPVPN